MKNTITYYVRTKGSVVAEKHEAVGSDHLDVMEDMERLGMRSTPCLGQGKGSCVNRGPTEVGTYSKR